MATVRKTYWIKRNRRLPFIRKLDKITMIKLRIITANKDADGLKTTIIKSIIIEE